MPRNRTPADEASPAEASGTGSTDEIAQILVRGDIEPSRLMELCYWSREPGILEIIRAYIGLPEPTQRLLSDFLCGGKPWLIEALTEPQGRLVLTQVSADPRTPMDRLRPLPRR